MVACECGCNREAPSGSRYINKDHSCGRIHTRRTTPRRVYKKREPKPVLVSSPCACGCEQMTSPGKTYVWGHHKRGVPSSSLCGPDNASWQGDDASLFAKYQRAHIAAKKRLGSKPKNCPTCGEPKKLELSYTGTKPTHFDDRRRPYDPSGLEYIYECHSCNVKRGYAVRRGNVRGMVDGPVSA